MEHKHTTLEFGKEDEESEREEREPDEREKGGWGVVATKDGVCEGEKKAWNGNIIDFFEKKGKRVYLEEKKGEWI